MYSQDRFFTFTGQRLSSSAVVVEERQEALNELHKSIFANQNDSPGKETVNIDGLGTLEDADLLQRASSSRDGDSFKRLWQGTWQGIYESQSEADLALCGKLYFWTRGDPMQMDRLFRQSGLFRTKWDERHFSSGKTYGESTLDRALSGHQARVMLSPIGSDGAAN
jgi:putative DNA primase/helicase